MPDTKIMPVAGDDSYPSLTGTCGALSITVCDGDATPGYLASRYAVLAYGTIAEHPAMLRRFDFADILTSDKLLAFVHHGEDLLAAAYARREMRGERRVLIHKGYVSSGRQAGLAKVMIAALHVADAHRHGTPADGEAVARVLPDGAINEASSSPFADAGFHGARNYTERIGTGDIHLEPIAQVRPDGLWVGCHLMMGKAERIAVRAHHILADWTLTFCAAR